MKVEYPINNLFIVVLGGKVKGSHIEQHDVRWVVGNTIEDTFDQLREGWFGEKKGLHIDSYIKVKNIDGYKVIIKSEDLSLNFKETKKDKSLWLINSGYYSQYSMYEKHKLFLVVAKNIFQARQIVRTRWGKLNEKIHFDNLHSISKVESLSPSESLNNKSGHQWRIILKEDNSLLNQELIPDWYGYLRIDSK